MINLLPTSLKAQVAYSKRNRILVRYVSAAAIVAVVAVGCLLGGVWYLGQRITAANSQLAAQDASIKQYSSLENKAKQLNARLASIQKIQSSQAKFSLLLADLASATPRGVAIEAIALTGDDKKPVRISASADTYRNATSYRDMLSKSSRIKAADLESVASNDKGKFQVIIAVAFTPGQSK